MSNNSNPELLRFVNYPGGTTRLRNIRIHPNHHQHYKNAVNDHTTPQLTNAQPSYIEFFNLISSGSPIEFTVPIDVSPFDTTITISTLGTAILGTDYSVSPMPLVVPAGGDSGVFTVTPLGSSIVVPKKIFIIVDLPQVKNNSIIYYVGKLSFS